MFYLTRLFYSVGLFCVYNTSLSFPATVLSILTNPKSKGRTSMKRINLKDYYGHITADIYIDIPDEVFNIFEEYRKAEQAYHSKINYHKAHYSLDRNDGIEHSALFVSLSPDEIYERKLTREQLHVAIATLPDKQAKRIYAHYFFGMSITAIAKAEGVNKSQITRSINRGLSYLEKYLKNVL